MVVQKTLSKYSQFGQAFISYGSYHTNFVNKIIHIFCIPLIAATLLYLLSYIPFSHTFENTPYIGSWTLGVAEAFGIITVAYYFYLNALFGLLSGFFFIVSSVAWKSFFKDYSNEQMLKYVLIIQIVAWILQFIGHGVFQKRKPALLDNVTQILNAPMFVLIQVCELFGLKNQQIKQWKLQIEKNVQKFKQQSKRSKKANQPINQKVQ